VSATAVIALFVVFALVQVVSVVALTASYRTALLAAIHAAVAQTPQEYATLERMTQKPPKVKAPKPDPVYPYGL
jgi:hypothetical protein